MVKRSDKTRAQPEKLWSLNEMEITVGKPDVIDFDAKTYSWLKTFAALSKLDGPIFGDYRYDMVFVYHNDAQSYYAARGFRVC